jgi:hypothetical protein
MTPAAARPKRVAFADYAKGFCIIIAFRLFLRALGDDPVFRQGALFRSYERLGLCWGIICARLHRAIRDAVVHLSAADLLHRNQGKRRVPPALIWLAAAALQTAQIDTGWTAIDEFAGRFVYFFTGYVLAPQVFALAGAVEARPAWAVAGLALWATVNGGLVSFGISGMPVVSLALGFVGAAAVVSLSALMAKADAFRPVRYCGQNSIVIYLAFFLPMAGVRTLLVKTGPIPDVGAMALLVTAAGVLGAFAIWWSVHGTRANFLFERPDVLRVAPRPRCDGAGRIGFPRRVRGGMAGAAPYIPNAWPRRTRASSRRATTSS